MALIRKSIAFDQVWSGRDDMKQKQKGNLGKVQVAKLNRTITGNIYITSTITTTILIIILKLVE